MSLFKRDLPTPPIPVQRWYADAEHVVRLREILNDPVYKQAVAVLKDLARPMKQSLTGTPEFNNNLHIWQGGYNQSFDDLEKLTRSPEKTNKATHLEEWTHIQPTQQ